MFTQYKFNPAEVSEKAAGIAQTLAAAKPGTNPATFAAKTIGDRLRAKPASYVQYGPYWWALKAAMRALGEDFGPADQADMRAEYGGDFPAYGAIVAAEQFRDYYGATFLQGTDRFDLDADGEHSYVLFDTDMEVRRVGARYPLRVAADMAGLVETADAVLDSADAPVALLDAAATPFAVKFEHDAALWTAHVYASDAEAAQGKVKGWEASGRIGEAIEFGRAAGEATLDSTDILLPLFVDTRARTVSEMAVSGALAHTR